MVSRAVSDVADVVVDAFSPAPRSKTTEQEIIQQIEDVRRMSSFHRDRWARSAVRRGRRAPSERQIRTAVFRVLREKQDARETSSAE